MSKEILVTNLPTDMAKLAGFKSGTMSTVGVQTIKFNLVDGKFDGTAIITCDTKKDAADIAAFFNGSRYQDHILQYKVKPMEQDAQELVAPPPPSVYNIRRLNDDLTPAEDWKDIQHYAVAAAVDICIVEHVKKAGLMNKVVDATEDGKLMTHLFEVKGGTITEPRIYRTTTEWGVKTHKGRVVIFPKTGFAMVKRDVAAGT